MKESQTVLNRALEINLNPQIYGAFAEIGAGQEVARFFFQAGKASQTIAKTISAYDMIYSDEIYGKETSGRYVCESRLEKMLDKEFKLLHRRLDATRGSNTCFFAFANTVATGDNVRRQTHGWMGIRFQTSPQGEANEIVLHVRMLDRFRLQQQENLGILGVNLVYTAFTCMKEPEFILDSLVANIKQGQVAIDLVRFTGPDLKHINNHLMNLELVRKGLADAILFGTDQQILTISDELFQKPVIIQRGTYFPVTKTHMDVLEKGIDQFKKDFPNDSKKPAVMFELTMQNLSQNGHIQEKEFLDRVTSLCSLGSNVLVSNFFLFYRLKKFLRNYTQKPMAFIMDASKLDRLFDESHYKDLEGGLLEGLGKLMDEQTRVYIYPHKTETLCTTTRTYFPDPKWLPIYQYFIAQKQILDISGCDEAEEYRHSDYVRDLILRKDPQWEKYVPTKVRDQIKKEKLFNFFEK
ncbi:MAG: hypothetical protein ACAH59_03750 [Pseudobdellovibrionaceae bacterium]